MGFYIYIVTNLRHYVQLLHCIAEMRTGLPLHHVLQQDQKLVGNVSWVTAIRKHATVWPGHVADEVENDALCPNRMFGSPPHQQNDTSLTRLISSLKFDSSVTKLSAMLSDH